jgi:hypothetical protein
MNDLNIESALEELRKVREEMERDIAAAEFALAEIESAERAERWLVSSDEIVFLNEGGQDGQ